MRGVIDCSVVTIPLYPVSAAKTRRLITDHRRQVPGTDRSAQLPCWGLEAFEIFLQQIVVLVLGRHLEARLVNFVLLCFFILSKVPLLFIVKLT
jgi:hypothetical protein